MPLLAPFESQLSHKVADENVSMPGSFPDRYGPDGQCSLWFEISVDEEFGLSLDKIGDDSCSKPEHWVRRYTCAYGFEASSLPDGDDLLVFALEHGIAPWQPFRIDFSAIEFVTYPSSPRSAEEYDEFWRWSVGWVEPITISESIESWDEYLRVCCGITP